MFGTTEKNGLFYVTDCYGKIIEDRSYKSADRAQIVADTANEHMAALKTGTAIPPSHGGDI